MGTIVCGVDGSSGSAAAVHAASILSVELGLRLVLAHVAADREQAAELLERVAAGEGRSARTAERRVAVGDPATSLARIAAEEAAAVIVIGARSHGRWRRRPLSDFAAELEGTASCPVFVVPPPRR